MISALTVEQLEILVKKTEEKLVVLENRKIIAKGELQHKLHMNIRKCDHKRVRKGGDISWENDIGYTYYGVWYECLDCGKVFLEEYTSVGETKRLEKNIVEILHAPSVGDPPDPYGKMVCNEIAEKETLGWPCGKTGPYDNIVCGDKLTIPTVISEKTI